MKQINKYIARFVLASIGFVLLLLIGLQSFILLVSEFSDLGHGQYKIGQAFFYILMILPYHMYLFFPIACLLGVLIGLGILAERRELLVMRTFGCSIFNISGAVFKALLPVVFIITIVGEMWIPLLARYGNDWKLSMKTQGKTFQTETGLWLKHPQHIIKIGLVLPNLNLKNVVEFQFSNDNILQVIRYSAEIVKEGQTWIAKNVSETVLNKDTVKTKTHSNIPWNITLNPNFLKLYRLTPEEMTLPQLSHYVRAEKENGTPLKPIEVMYWQRVFSPFTTFIMIFIAIPFIFGPLRSSTMGAKILTGALLGFSFYMLNRFLIPLAYLLHGPAVFIALTPGLIFILIGIYFVYRMK